MKKVLIAMQCVHANDILKDMTRDALGSIKSIHDWSVFVDGRDISLASKWNYALDLGQDYDYLLLVNNDILFYEDTIDNLIKDMEDNPDYAFISSSQVFEFETPERKDGFDEEKLHWSFVGLRPLEIIRNIGWVDTIFERGSFVDTEWAIRTKKLGYKMARSLSSLFFHFNDSTHRFLPDYRSVFGLNDRKLRAKWGNSYEFEFPYNDKDLPLNFIGKYDGPSTKR